MRLVSLRPAEHQNGGVILSRHISRARGYLSSDGLGPFLVRSVAGTGAVRGAAMVASFAVGVLLARRLGVQGFGYYSIAYAVITIASIPGEFGLPFLVTREVASAAAVADDAKLFGVIRWATGMCLLVAGGVGLAVLVGGAVAYAAGSRLVGAALLLGAPVIPLIALAKVRSSSLQGLNHIVLGQIPPNLLRPLFFALLLGLAWLAGMRLSAPLALALQTVAAAAVLAVAYIWLKRRLPANVPPETVRSGRQWLASTVPLGLMGGIQIVQPESAILLLGLLASPASVGLLRIANSTMQIAAGGISVLNEVAMPVMARLYAQGDRERLQKTVTSVARAQFGATVLISIPLLLFPRVLLSFAFGAEFAPASTALMILMVGQIANAAFGPNAWLLNMTHHERQVAWAMGIGLGVTVVLVPPLALMWGVSGAAVGLLASMLTWNVIAWHDARKHLGIETSILRWTWFDAASKRRSAAGEHND